MSKIYRRYCDYCGQYYEKKGAKRFCSIDCVGKYNAIRPRFPNEPTKAELEQLYIKEHLSIPEISERLQISKSCIDRRLRKYDIPRRKQTEAQKNALKRGRLKSGSNHPSWKNGKRTKTNGYIYIKMPNHHRANNEGYVPEHVVNWEKANNKNLPKNWLVHHINGNKHDNHPTNLKGMPKGKHHSKLLILELQKRIRELELTLKEFFPSKNYHKI